MSAYVRRVGWLTWEAVYPTDGGIATCTDHITPWGARWAARRWDARRARGWV